MAVYQLFLKKMKEKKYSPAYLFYGDEKYLQEELVRQLAVSYLGPDLEYGIEKLEGSATELGDIIGRLNESGLFSSRRILIIDSPPYLAAPRNEKAAQKPDKNKEKSPEKAQEKEEAALLDDYLKLWSGDTPDNILVFLSPGVDRRKRIFKILGSRGEVVECSALKGEALAEWINHKAARLNKKIERGALEKLMLADGNNLHYLSAELEKYSTYLGANEDTITFQVVEKLFSGDLQGDVFKLSDAMAEGDMLKAHHLLEYLLRKREKPLLIFFMLVRHYRLLLEAHCLLKEGIPQGEFASTLAVHPFVARKLREQAVTYERLALEDILLALQQADMQIKTGKIDPAQALALTLNRIDYIQKSS